MKSFSILVFTIFLTGSRLQAQEKDYMISSDWRIYDIQGHGIFHFSTDTLQSFKSLPLNDDSIRFYLTSFKEDTTGPLAWMGGYVVSFRTGSSIRKIEVSNYGGYFYEDKARKYYTLPPGLVSPWLSYFKFTFDGFRK
jgi:hypothetical protein